MIELIASFVFPIFAFLSVVLGLGLLSFTFFPGTLRKEDRTEASLRDLARTFFICLGITIVAFFAQSS